MTKVPVFSLSEMVGAGSEGREWNPYGLNGVHGRKGDVPKCGADALHGEISIMKRNQNFKA